MKRNPIDIHDYQDQLQQNLARVQQTHAVSTRNKQLILRFDEETRIKEGIGRARRCKVLSTLRLLAVRHVRKDFDNSPNEIWNARCRASKTFPTRTRAMTTRSSSRSFYGGSNGEIEPSTTVRVVPIGCGSSERA